MDESPRNNKKVVFIVELVFLVLGILISLPPTIISGQWLFLSELRFYNGNVMLANWILMTYMAFSFLILEVVCLIHLIGITRKKRSLSTGKTVLFALIINFGLEAVFFLSYWLSWGAGSIYDVPLYFFVFLTLMFVELVVLVYLILNKAKFIQS
ncbi:MAG: hypothetical protein WC479_10005 [Candidatus Izemoplasmatales bacterium]